MNLVIRFIMYLLLGVVIGLALVSGAPKAQQSTSYRIVDNPKIQRPVLKKQGLFPTKIKSAKPTLRKGQLFKIGIVDTGYDKEYDQVGVPLCDKGSYDFGIGEAKVGAGSMPHGTAVAQAIMETVGDTNICFVFYQVEGFVGITSENVDAALKMARGEGLVAVNMSLTGPGYSFSEKKLIEDLAKVGVSTFIAAGNDHKNLDSACTSYPACYKIPNTYVVGALDGESDLPAAYSNQGTKIDIWKSGDIQFNGQRWRGTSFASPHALGDYVKSLAEALSEK